MKNETQESVIGGEFEKPSGACEHGATCAAVKTDNPAESASQINGSGPQGDKRASTAEINLRPAKHAGENRPSCVHSITTKDGLLYCDNEMINLPEADLVAWKCGFQYAEQMVAYMEKTQARYFIPIDPETIKKGAFAERLVSRTCLDGTVEILYFKTLPAPYGYCPVCGAPGEIRERRPGGNDTCRNGHIYQSASAESIPRFDLSLHQCCLKKG